ncbi:hypothetical protein [Marinomonas sp.]
MHTNSPHYQEPFDLLNPNIDLHSSDFEKMDKLEKIQIEVSTGLEEALLEMEQLKKQSSSGESEKLLDLCKTNIFDTITSQFGLASLVIDSRDGGNVTTTHNFEKGITSNAVDSKKYEDFQSNNNGTKKWQDVRSETGYDSPLANLRKKAFQENEVIIDQYTGKPLPKDGRTHIDHVVSAKEIERNAATNLHLSPEERAKLATQDENLAFTSGPANQSKGDKSMDEWLDGEHKKSGGTNAKYFDIDKEKAKAVDQKARKEINREINKAAVKKYSKELLTTGAKDAAKIAAYSALGVIIRECIKAIFDEIKATFSKFGEESFKSIFKRFKSRIKITIETIKSNWKDTLSGSIEAGVTAFLSNIVVFAINLFATTLKRFVSMIRAGFVSLVQAIKILVSPPSNMTKEESRYQALKILTAGLIGAASLALTELIEKFLLSIPGIQPLMLFPLPSFGGEQRTVSDAIAVTLSSIAGGLLTTIVLYMMDSFRNSNKKAKLQIQMVYQSGVVVEYKIAQSWFALSDAYKYLEVKAHETKEVLAQTHKAISESHERIQNSKINRKNAMAALRNKLQ